MLSGRNVLLWCLDPAYQPIKYIDRELIGSCNYFIPVYCFDERLKLLDEKTHERGSYAIHAINKVEKLRHKLRSSGSDLLIATGSFETIIPSLARVLQTAQVIALVDEYAKGDVNKASIQQFQKEKIKKTGDLLSRHSIDFKIIDSSHQQTVHHAELTFPPFPEIETGTVPRG